MDKFTKFNVGKDLRQYDRRLRTRRHDTTVQSECSSWVIVTTFVCGMTFMLLLDMILTEATR